MYTDTNVINLASQQAKNVIYTGVAGTGKTYQLQQLAKQYTQQLEIADRQQIIHTLVTPLSWRDLLCLIFWEYQQTGKELLTVAEISEHEFFVTKVHINKRQQSPKTIVREILTAHTATNTLSDGHTATDCIDRSYFVQQKLADDNLQINDNHAVAGKKQLSNSGYWYLHDNVNTVESQLKCIWQDAHTALNNQRQASLQPQELQKNYAFVSFHQSYGYDEFVEGIRPVIDEHTGQMRYQIVDGVFLRLCQQARRNPTTRYAMLIDEINRANVVQVFGELMSLIEIDKRQGQTNELTVSLAYSGRNFSIPSNIDIFATMNTQDHSLVALDQAFRRRFQFVELRADSSILPSIADINGENIELGSLLTALNQKICQYLGSQYQLGHAYFIGVNNILDLVIVMARQLIPQLLMSCQNPQILANILVIDTLPLETVPWLITETALTNADGNSAKHSFTSDMSFALTQGQGFAQPVYILNPQLSALLQVFESNEQVNRLQTNISDSKIDNVENQQILISVIQETIAQYNISNNDSLRADNADLMTFFTRAAFLPLFDNY